MRLRQNANNRVRHKRSENQIHRTRVREVRIQFPPAVSQANSSAAGLSGVETLVAVVEDLQSSLPDSVRVYPKESLNKGSTNARSQTRRHAG